MYRSRIGVISNDHRFRNNNHTLWIFFDETSSYAVGTTPRFLDVAIMCVRVIFYRVWLRNLKSQWIHCNSLRSWSLLIECTLWRTSSAREPVKVCCLLWTNAVLLHKKDFRPGPIVDGSSIGIVVFLSFMSTNSRCYAITLCWLGLPSSMCLECQNLLPVVNTLLI